MYISDRSVPQSVCLYNYFHLYIVLLQGLHQMIYHLFYAIFIDLDMDFSV